VARDRETDGQDPRAISGVSIVIGGEHVASMPEFSLLTSKIDIAVLGEGRNSDSVGRALREKQPQWHFRHCLSRQRRRQS
jgi:hypothetical protein